MVGLATVATVIASQAVISGVFSITSQAVQLNYLPRFEVAPHLGARDRPDLRAADELAADAGVLALVLTFRSSGNLAAAYGIAVTGTMALGGAGRPRRRRLLGLGRGAAALVVGLLLLVDLAFLAANTLKVADGGWFPLAVALRSSA